MWFFGLRLKTYVKDRSIQPELLEIEDRRARKLTLFDNIDNGGFQKLVVFNSGVGFAAGAYQIFAVGVTLPIIEMVYYFPHAMSHGHEGWLRIAPLIGAIVGQIGAGFLSDIYGRRSLYGYELLVLLIGTLGASTASRGEAKSMSIFSWLFAWRFIMGIGIGADYPLSASMAAEFAPRKHRARMLASVFYAQLLGYFFAALVGLMTLATHHDSIPHALQTRECNSQCRRALDKSWRTIIGVGAILAIIAACFRRAMPESPRYTAEILNRVEDAQEDVQSFMGARNPSRTNSASAPIDVEPPSPHTTSDPIGAVPDTIEYTAESAHQSDNISYVRTVPDEDTLQSFSYRAWGNLSSFHEHFWTNGYARVLFATSLAWFCLDAAYYALVGASSSTIATKVFNTLPLTYNCTVSADATLGSAMDCSQLDFDALYPRPLSIWASIFSNLWHVLILVCAGSVPAGAIMIWLVKHHSLRRLQIMGFIALAVIFIVTGAILRRAPAESVTGASVWLYVAAQVVFQIGPNFTTFMLPAELAPTKHRGLAHGIAAASGKLGGCAFVLFFEFVKFPGNLGADDPKTRWLGSALLCFMPAMVLGAYITWIWVPETRDKHGKDRSLEELETLMPRARGSDGVFATLASRLRARRQRGAEAERIAMQPKLT